MHYFINTSFTNKVEKQSIFAYYNQLTMMTAIDSDDTQFVVFGKHQLFLSW